MNAAWAAKARQEQVSQPRAAHRGPETRKLHFDPWHADFPTLPSWETGKRFSSDSLGPKVIFHAAAL